MSEAAAVKFPARIVGGIGVGVIFTSIVCYYSGVWWGDVLSGMAVDTAVVAVWLAAAVLLGLIVIRRMRVGGLLGFCTSAGLGLGFLSLVILAMGLMGILNRLSGILLLAISAAAGLLDLFLSRRPDPPLDQQPSSWAWLWVIVVPFAALAIVGTNVFPAVLWKPHDPHPYDVLCYHLQVPREWYELGRIVPLRHNVYSFFPFAAEMNYLLGMHLRGGPWAGMYQAQLMSFTYMALAVMSVAAAMPTRRAGVIAALAMATLPWTVMLGSIAYNEPALLLYTSLAAAWILRALRTQVEIGKSMAMAGVMAGFACGAKYTAAPIVLIGFAIAALLAAKFSPRMVKGAAIAMATGLAVFSPWLIRNAIWAGNPVFPLAMRQLDHAHFTPEQVERFERAHRAPEDESSAARRVIAFRSEILRDWRFGFLLIPLGVISIALNWRRPEVIFLALSLLFIIVFWLGLTHLMGRFFVPAIPVLALLVGYIVIHERFAIATAGAVILMAISSFIGLHREFLTSMQISNAYNGLIRLRNPSELWPEKLADIESKDAMVALIGDAQAFYRHLPMSRLEYRSIFDVVVPPGKNIVDAWLGRDLEELRKDHYIILNPGELNRLSRTYYGIPPVPPQWRQEGDETIILAPTGH